MRRQAKKALYESIMKDIAKVVRRKLNESAEDIESLKDELMSYGRKIVDLSDKSMSVSYKSAETSGGRIVDEFEKRGWVDIVVVDRYSIEVRMDDGEYVDIDDIASDDVMKVLLATRDRI